LFNRNIAQRWRAVIGPLPARFGSRSAIPRASRCSGSAARNGTDDLEAVRSLSALMSESRHSRNIPIGGHFPALGMPDRPFVMSSACGSTRLRDSHATSAFPFRCPLGDRGPVSASGPALSNGTGYFRRSSRGPRRTEGCGEVRRGQRGLIVSGESASAARQQSNDADPLSVGFSTRSTRMQAACPPCNTSARSVIPLRVQRSEARKS